MPWPFTLRHCRVPAAGLRDLAGYSGDDEDTEMNSRYACMNCTDSTDIRRECVDQQATGPGIDAVKILEGAGAIQMRRISYA